MEAAGAAPRRRLFCSHLEAHWRCMGLSVVQPPSPLSLSGAACDGGSGEAVRLRPAAAPSARKPLPLPGGMGMGSEEKGEESAR